MKNKARLFIIFLFPLSLQAQDGICYVSLNRAVQLGQYDGVASLDTLKKYGDFAIGSTDKIGAELVMVDGKAYSIPADAPASPMTGSTMLPFAAAKFFRPEKTFAIHTPVTLETLQNYLDSVLRTSRFAAIKITGVFDSISYKCYYAQQKPYPPIKEARVKIFDSLNVHGTIAGFFTPKSAAVLNDPNYHFHFINNYLTSGGHVEKLFFKRATIEIDYADELHVLLPNEQQSATVDLNKPIEK